MSALHSPGPLNNSDLVELQMASPKMIYFCVSWSTVPLKRLRSHHGSTHRLYHASSRGKRCTSRSKTYMRRRGCADEGDTGKLGLNGHLWGKWRHQKWPYWPLQDFLKCHWWWGAVELHCSQSSCLWLKICASACFRGLKRQVETSSNIRRLHAWRRHRTLRIFATENV